MTKQEFLDILGRALNRELSAEETAENLHYYENYIRQEVSRGKSEEQVLAELGDPRLIARTILELDQQKGDDMRSSAETVYTENADGSYSGQEAYGEDYREGYGPSGGKRFEVRAGGFKGWLILGLVILVIVAVLGAVFSLLWTLLPFLIVIWGIMWLYRRFR